MTIDYQIINSMPTREVLDGIIKLHSEIFLRSDDLISKMKDKPRLLVIVAKKGTKIVGYKIGYEIDKTKFYSWLGGVSANYRKHGIASTLMKKQHQHLRENGYTDVQTKTMNKWRDMLVLNIKNGFNVMGTYKDNKGLHKIILEKSLLK